MHETYILYIYIWPGTYEREYEEDLKELQN